MGAAMTQGDVHRRRGVRGWGLWGTPPAPLAFILVVEALVAVGLVAGFSVEHVVGSDLVHFAVLFGIAAVYSEAADRIDRMRRYLFASAGAGVAADGLWCFTAALVLPLGLAGAFAVLIFVHALIRSARHQAAVPYRLVFTACTVILATLLAGAVVLAFDPGRHLVLGGRLGVVGVLLALGIYPLTNQALITGVLYLVRRPVPIRELLISMDDQLLELATLCVGVLLAETLLQVPELAPLSIVLVVVLRRSALVRVLQQQATRDVKTGLLNAAAWRQQAENELQRASRDRSPVTVLMIDLDRFKELNDSYGHLAGDNTLRAVASSITDTLRGSDVVGRYGGEEFVALLPGVDLAGGQAAAERLCARIRGLSLAHGGSVSASIGVSTAERTDGILLDTLVADADSAMYRAKNGGRDQVRVGRRQTPDAAGVTAR